jgi:hypothetical protein
LPVEAAHTADGALIVAVGSGLTVTLTQFCVEAQPFNVTATQ